MTHILRVVVYFNILTEYLNNIIIFSLYALLT